MVRAEVEGGEIQVELVWSPQAGDVRRVDLRLPRACTLAQALQACAEFQPMLGHLAEFKLGIWGRQQPLSTVLREHDRIEIYRALTVDPKEARRQRYKDRGERIVSRHRPLAGKTSRQS